MPRTNVVGTTAAAGSGAQRCAQAGEREHRTDSTTGTAVTTAANRLSPAARGADSRNSLQFHPLADIFPLMEGEEFDALVADIKANGLRELITVYQNKILDGRNRYHACRALGIEPRLTPFTGDDGAARAFVISKNLRRRHLDPETKIKILAQLVAAQPEKSDRKLAKEAGVDHKTIAKARKKGEATGEVSPVEKRVGADGKARKQPAKAAPTKAAKTKAKTKVLKHDSRIIAPKLADRVGRFAHDLILSERLLARELADIIMLPGVRERLSADLTNGLRLAGNDDDPETSVEARKAEFAALDGDIDPGPLPEILRRG